MRSETSEKAAPLKRVGKQTKTKSDVSQNLRAVILSRDERATGCEMDAVRTTDKRCVLKGEHGVLRGCTWRLSATA